MTPWSPIDDDGYGLDSHSVVVPPQQPTSFTRIVGTLALLVALGLSAFWLASVFFATMVHL